MRGSRGLILGCYCNHAVLKHCWIYPVVFSPSRFPLVGDFMGEIKRLPIKPRALREHQIAPELLNPGLFRLSFNNRRRQGMQGPQTHECQGSLYDSGHVHLDTQFLQVRDFLSIQQMIDYLHDYGDCAIIEGETV